jgi:hypothetical protein
MQKYQAKMLTSEHFVLPPLLPLQFDWLVWVACFLTTLFAGVDIGIGVGIGKHRPAGKGSLFVTTQHLCHLRPAA